MAGNSPYTDDQLMNTTFDLVFSTGVHNDTCKEWLQVPAAIRTWANFKTHFTKIHRLLHELQTSAAQEGYTANNVFADSSQSEAAKAIAPLEEATEAGQSMVANLAITNQTFLDQVANMTAQMSAKDNKLNDLRESIDLLNLTIRVFANMDNNTGGSYKKQGKQKMKKGGKGSPITIHYCWTCG
eukprot:15349129-Ditylum_brightwellii.AAC.2